MEQSKDKDPQIAGTGAGIGNLMKAFKPRRTTRNSKRIHWFNGHRIDWGRSHQQGFERWAKLINRPNLSEAFKHQIERNLREKS